MAPSHLRSTQYRVAETTIGKDCLFVGALTTDGNVQIDGVFEGEITSTMHVQVNNTGRVRAHLNVDACTVHGSVVGNIIATSDVVLASSARVWGQIDATSLQIQQGAVFKGSSQGKDEEVF
jgi:cytoskeletal protein CcmA (bactofilin family)